MTRNNPVGEPDKKGGDTNVALNRSHRPMRVIAAVLALTLVGACETIEDLNPFGKDDEAPLKGERISVLLHERSLSPDADAQGADVLLPAPTPNADWPMAGGYANHAMHHIQVSDALAEAWSRDIGAGADDEERFSSPPVVAAGRVYAMDVESTVSAFDAKTGGQIWNVDLTPDEEDDGHIPGGLAVDGSTVYVTTGFAEVIALGTGGGLIKWRKNVGAPLRAAPTARGGRVFAITVDNRLVALDGNTGEQLWDHTGITEVASLLGGASPAVAGGVVVAAYSSGEILALKVETGRVLWQDSLATVKRTDVVSTLAQIRGHPVIDRGRVIAVSHGGVTAALDLRNGRRLWSREIGGAETPWVAGDYIFMLTNDAEIICINRNTGKVLWVRGLPRYEDPEDREDLIIWTGPILASDRLIVAGSDGRALAVSPYDGAILGVVKMPDGVAVPPVVADGSVYFLANDAELVAYR